MSRTLIIYPLQESTTFAYCLFEIQDDEFYAIFGL